MPNKKKNKKQKKASGKNKAGAPAQQQGGHAVGSSKMQVDGFASGVKKSVNQQKKESKKQQRKENKKLLKNAAGGGKNNKPRAVLKTHTERAVLTAGAEEPGIVRHSMVTGESGHNLDVMEILCEGDQGTVYTVSRDKKIISWQLQEKETETIADSLNLLGGGGTTAASSSSSSSSCSQLFGGFSFGQSAAQLPTRRFCLTKTNTIEMPCAIWSALFQANCLFVGLGSGVVKVFAKHSGETFEFQAHEKRVNCIRRHEQSGILITADNGGILCSSNF